MLAQRARLEGRQGRLQAALLDVSAAERLIREHPALHRLRGDAYATVWRWEEAAAGYRAAAEGAPLDDSRWADLARALGSSEDDHGALEAVRHGLIRQPRDEAMLGSQVLASQRVEPSEVDATREAYLAHRIPDRLSSLQLRCGEAHEWCAREHVPVHVHDLRLHTSQTDAAER